MRQKNKSKGIHCSVAAAAAVVSAAVVIAAAV
jgi:hypothetical protein